jgi:RNA polymerase sigma-70 factor (ECF subfamily)
VWGLYQCAYSSFPDGFLIYPYQGGLPSTYNLGGAMSTLAGAGTLGDLAGAIGFTTAESAIIAELKAGSEDAYASLIGEFHQPIYSLVHRVLNDPADAADTTQEVFLKVFRGMKHFNGQSSLKTWIYRIAIHEASNRRRWWFRHKAQEVPIGDDEPNQNYRACFCVSDKLVDRGDSPFDSAAHEEVRTVVEQEIRKVPEPFRTTIILRDLEGMAYEEIAEIMQISLGTVKSRVTRGRDALRKRLVPYVQKTGYSLGLSVSGERKPPTSVSPTAKPLEVIS